MIIITDLNIDLPDDFYDKYYAELLQYVSMHATRDRDRIILS